MPEKMLFLIVTVIQIGLTMTKSSGWLEPSVAHYSATDVDPGSADLQEFSPESSYVDLKFSWSGNRRLNANFVVLTFLYSSDGTYIGRTALYYFVRQGVPKRHSLRLFYGRSKCFDDTTLRGLKNLADEVSWAVLGDDEPFAMVNGNVPARNLRRCSGPWQSAMRQGGVSRVRVAVHNFAKSNLDDTVKIEWRIRSRVPDRVIAEWTPIYNSTTERYDVGDFHLKSTQHKEADKYLYLAQGVTLYNNDGTKLGNTNVIFYLNPKDGKVKFSGYKRFYLGSTQCSRKIDFPYLDTADFEMITAVRSADMFQFRVSGEQHNEKMGDCTNYGDWQEAVKQASTMEMTLYTWAKDLPDYFSTEYKVVN